MAITRDELQRLIDVADLDFGSRHDVVKSVKSITSDYDRAIKTITGLDYNRTVKTIIAGYPKFDEIARVVSENNLVYQTSANLLAQKLADAQSNIQSLIKQTPLSALKTAQDYFLSLGSVAWMQDSLASKILARAFIPELSLQTAIKHFTDMEFGRLYSIKDFALSDILHSVSYAEKALDAMRQFYTSQVELTLKAFEPLSRYYAQLQCDVNSVTVDISHGTEKVIHAEYDRKNAIELLTAIIVLKDAHPKGAIEVKGSHVDSEGLFDCSDDHDTHYAEFQGQVDINIEDDTKPITITDCFQQLVQEGHVDETSLEDARFLALRGERFFRRNFARVFYHGLLFLAEASVNYALDNPVSAEEYRELERMMGDSLRKQLPKPSTGGNTRGGEAWKKLSSHQFAKRVDELYDTAEALLKGYNQHKSNARWLEMLKLSDGFKPFLKTCSENLIDEVALLIPIRLKECRSKNHKHGSTPLAFACELASRELNIRKKDNTSYGSDYLLRKYREGEGLHGKERRQTKTPRAAKKLPPQ